MFRKRTSPSHHANKANRPRRQSLERLEDRVCLSAAPNWAIGLGGQFNDVPMALTVDAQDNTYLAAGITDASGGQQVIIAKYDFRGIHVGDLTLASISASQSLNVSRLDIDNAGTLLVAGDFSGSLDLLPDQPGGELASIGGKDVFLAKYTWDSANHTTLDWTERFGGSADDVAGGLSRVGNDVYVVGTFDLTATFNTATVTLSSTVGSETAAFLFHVADAGNTASAHWARQLQDSGSMTPNDILVTDDGQIFIAGLLGGARATKDHITSFGSTVLSTGVYYDALLLKYQAASDGATLQWAYQIAHSTDIQLSRATGLVRGSDGSIYVVGDFRSYYTPTDFGVTQLTAYGPNIYDGFVVRIDEVDGNGQATWVRQLDTNAASHDSVFWFGVLRLDVGIAPSLTGDTIYVSGTFDGTADFEPAIEGDQPGSSLGAGDVFLLQLKVDATGSTYVASWKSGGSQDDNLLYRMQPNIVVSPSGSVYQAARCTSPLVQTPGGTVVSHGGHDAVVVHVNASVPQIHVTPFRSVTDAAEMEQQNAYRFQGQAIDPQDGDLSDQIDWTLIVEGASSEWNHVDSIDLGSPLPLGRHTLALQVTDTQSNTADYRYVFDVAPNAPTNLRAVVKVGSKTSSVTLSWLDTASNESGYQIESSENDDPLGFWRPVGIVAANATGCVITVSKSSQPVSFRIRSYSDVNSALTVVSPAVEVVTVNPSRKGTYYSVTTMDASLLATSSLVSGTAGDPTLEVTMRSRSQPRTNVNHRATVGRSIPCLAVPAADNSVGNWAKSAIWDEDAWSDDSGSKGRRAERLLSTEFDGITPSSVGAEQAIVVDWLFAEGSH